MVYSNTSIVMDRSNLLTAVTLAVVVGLACPIWTQV